MKVGIVNLDPRLVQSRSESVRGRLGRWREDQNRRIWHRAGGAESCPGSKGLTPTIKAIMLGLSENACRVSRKLLFFSNAQPFDGQGNGQISPNPVTHCLLSCAAG